jgi:hypothetical protein
VDSPSPGKGGKLFFDVTTQTQQPKKEKREREQKEQHTELDHQRVIKINS